MEALSLFDFDVEKRQTSQMPLKADVRKPAPSSSKRTITRQDLLERAKRLKAFLDLNKDYKPYVDGPIKDELQSTIEAARIQLTQLKKELR